MANTTSTTETFIWRADALMAMEDRSMENETVTIPTGSRTWVEVQRRRMWQAYENGDLTTAANIAAVITASRPTRSGR